MRSRGNGVRSGAEETGCGAEETGCGAEETGCGAEETGCGAEETGCGAEETGCGAEEKGYGANKVYFEATVHIPCAGRNYILVVSYGVISNLRLGETFCDPSFPHSLTKSIYIVCDFCRSLAEQSWLSVYSPIQACQQSRFGRDSPDF